MTKQVKDLMLSLSEYAVVHEDATILDALLALEDSQVKVPEGKQPHRAILVRNLRGEIVGKLHHFAFLRALLPAREPTETRNLFERAGVGDDLRDASMRTLDFLTGDLVDVCERARHVAVREVYSPATLSLDEEAPLSDAISMFLRHQTLSLLVRRDGRTVGILRLSDLFDELSHQMLHGAQAENPEERS